MELEFVELQIATINIREKDKKFFFNTLKFQKYFECSSIPIKEFQYHTNTDHGI